MNKFNRKFNNICSRFSFWQVICAHFNGFVDLLKAPDALTSADRHVLQSIHGLLIKGYEFSKERKNFHNSELQRLLRKDYRKSCK